MSLNYLLSNFHILVRLVARLLVYKKHRPLLLGYKKPALKGESGYYLWGEKTIVLFNLYYDCGMQGTYDENELKRIILGDGTTPDFGAEYDSLETIPMVRNVEEINEGAVGDTLVRASLRTQELSNQGFMVDMGATYSGAIRLVYYRPQTREEYINEKLSQWRGRSSSVNYKHYLFSTLGLRYESSIRAIYVKLLLEHKITLEDFADLVQAKDMDIDLLGLCGGFQLRDSTYFI